MTIHVPYSMDRLLQYRVFEPKQISILHSSVFRKGNMQGAALSVQANQKLGHSLFQYGSTATRVHAGRGELAR